MDTPRITRRNSTQTKTPNEVRSRLFTQDSGIGASPSPWAPTTIRTRRSQFRPRCQNGEPTLGTNEVGQCAFVTRDEESDYEPDSNGWSTFWLWWISFLIMICGCIVFAWVNFPKNRAVQLSQEYTMKGLLALSAVMISPIFIKVLWRLCRGESG